MRPWVPRLHVITDTVVQDRFSHVELAQMALRGGADCVQLREKEAGDRAVLAQARLIADACRRFGAWFVVDDRLDVALAADAGGLHLGRKDLPIAVARRLLGPQRLIGATAHTVEEALQASAQGCDYLGCGPVYETRSKADARAPIGPTGLALIAAAVDVPVIAIGGIDADRVGEVLEAGAWGVAVLGAVAASADPEAATRSLRAALDRVLSGRPDA